MTTAHSTWAECYDDVYRRSFGTFYDDLTALTVESVIGIQPPPARIVDFGAGTGRLALPLARAGYSVTAVEPCVEMLDILKSQAAKDNLSIDCFNCRMEDEFRSDPFDLAVCVFTVLIYLLDDAALNASLRRAASVLREGGQLLFDVPTKRLFQSRSVKTDDFVRDVRITPETGPIFRYDESIRLLKQSGWVSYEDSFRIRYWQQSQVKNALATAGFRIKSDLSESFAATGSRYFLATR